MQSSLFFISLKLSWCLVILKLTWLELKGRDYPSMGRRVTTETVINAHVNVREHHTRKEE